MPKSGSYKLCRISRRIFLWWIERFEETLSWRKNDKSVTDTKIMVRITLIFRFRAGKAIKNGNWVLISFPRFRTGGWWSIARRRLMCVAGLPSITWPIKPRWIMVNLLQFPERIVVDTSRSECGKKASLKFRFTIMWVDFEKEKKTVGSDLPE